MKLEWGRGNIGALALALAAASVVGLLMMKAPPGRVTRMDHQQQMKDAEVKQRFEQAVVMLHAKQYDHAVTALHRVLELAPKMAEAHVNMGFALLGQQRGDAARSFFLSAIELRAQQANAYYGLAMAEEMRSDYAAALGGMRTYLHLSKGDEPYRNKARAAIWEWEEKLGRNRKG